ncbi:hypothetical protein Sm713_76560 [Streptomyces sp. TS71-3]|nr:hypothetical protein Sm713_76560 [Streptomyces sp. TS71-3]
MHVTRRRRRTEREQVTLFGRRVGRRTSLVTVGVAVALAVTGTAMAQPQRFGFDQVGQTSADGLTVADNQHINPIGDRHLKISGNDVGQEGPTYSPDGKQPWLGRANGFTKFAVNADGSLSSPQDVTIAASGSQQALTAAAVFSADGSTVYTAVNGQNRVVALDAATGTVKQSWDTGNAPRGMVQVGSKLYVSNEGGRTAKPGETTMNSYGTQVPADAKTGATTTGTVSVVDLSKPAAAPANIDVGLHPTSVYARNGVVFVTDTASNEVSVIYTRRDKVVQTIATQPWPEASVGYEPDAVTLTDDGRLLVTLGRANAVAVYRYKSAQDPVSYVSLLPTDYFPAEIATVGKDVLVSNTARGPPSPSRWVRRSRRSTRWPCPASRSTTPAFRTSTAPGCGSRTSRRTAPRT